MSELAAETAIELRNAIYTLVRRLQSFSFDADLTIPQATVLSLLDRQGPFTGADLAARERVRPQSMSGILAPLSKRGLVVKTSHTSDERKLLIAITDDGRKAIENERIETVRVMERAIRGDFTENEQELLLATIPLLRRLSGLI